MVKCQFMLFNYVPSTFLTDRSVGVTAKACARFRFTVGHEIAHNFGADHDKMAVSPPGPVISLAGTKYEDNVRVLREHR